MIRKVITWVLVMIMVVSVSVPVQAAESDQEVIGGVVITKKEELYEGFVRLTTAEQHYSSMEDAIEQLGDMSRTITLERIAQTVQVYVPVTIETGKQMNDIEDNKIFGEAIRERSVMERTGNPEAGKTFAEEYNSSGYEWLETPEYQDGIYTGVYYMERASQTPDDVYQDTRVQLQGIYDSFDLEGKSDYEKTVIIADWIKNNIQYDKQRAENMSSLASVVTTRKGACGEYANLFYYLATKAGLNVLYDHGASGSDYHAWNLVELDGKYYYLDAQGFIGQNNISILNFLYGTNDFDCYSFLDLPSKYPVAEEMYTKDHSACNGNHDIDMENYGQSMVCDMAKSYRCKNCPYTYSVPGDGDNHQWNKTGKVTQEADCENPEITTYYCSYNFITSQGYGNHPVKEVETAPALGHDLVTETKDATCTEPGSETTTCQRCGKVEKKMEIEALGHDYEMTTEVPPTCTEQGQKIYTCSRCGDTYTEAGAPSTGHNYVISTVEPTCTVEGEKTYTCECGDTYNETIDALGHEETVAETVPAGCETNETDVYVCSRCQERRTEEKEGTALGHDWKKEQTQNPTCTEPGSETTTCQRCGTKKTETLPATGHQNVQLQNAEQATCEKDGFSGDVVCKDCGVEIEKGTVIPALGHVYDEGITVKEPTYQEEGLFRYTCTVCDATKDEILPAKTHEHTMFERIVDKAPTCMEPGIERVQCMYCEFYYEEELPAKGHGKTEIKNQKDPTCAQTGYTGDTVCKDCQTVLQTGELLPVKDHIYDNGIVTNPATCKEEGLKTYTCINCDATKTESIPVSTKHTWDEGIVKVDPTCNLAGEKEFTCTVCQTTKRESVPATEAHVWDDGTVTKQATCTESGSKTYQCSICDANKTETIAKIGHKYTNWVKTANETVFRQAIRKHTCSVCKKTESEYYGSKLARRLSVNTSSLKLKRKQSTSKFKVSLAAGDSVVSWKSSNKKIFKVYGKANGSCKIKAGSKTGSAKLTITLRSGLRKTIKVKVQKSAVSTTSIKGIPKRITLKKGKTYALKPTIGPITSTSKTSYKSNSKKIAKVSSKGVIKGMKKGKTKITVKNGRKKVTCTVTVK